MNILPLQDALAKIDETFSIKAVLKDFDQDVMAQYYKQSERGYRRYHSQEGSLHFALNEDGVFDPAGYYGQPKFVEQQLQAISAQRVLEVGSGKGFNSEFLAQRHPQVEFVGLDLMPLNIKLAQRKANALTNLSFQLGDFNHIPFPDQQFDVVFGVECLCYSLDNHQTLAELYRVLKPGGRLVVFDGYRNPGFETFPEEVQLAVSLFETSMAVQQGMNEIAAWIETSQKIGFILVENTDITESLYPNIDHLHRLALRYFAANGIMRRLSLFFQKYLVRNAIFALVGPTLFGQGIASYYRTVAERPKS
jgi:ubiquinone/menaquinone biosynthesis C-methylase UbiE